MSTLEDDLTLLQKEPALITGVVVAVVGVLGTVGLQIDDNTTAAVSALIMAVLALVGALVVRKKVTPTVKSEVAKSKAVADVAASMTKVVASTQSDDEVIEAPAPIPDAGSDDSEDSEDLEYDSSAVVGEENTVVENDTSDESGVVESKVEEESAPLEDALDSLEAASAAKEKALEEAAKSLEAVKAEAEKASSDYQSRIQTAEQKLTEAKASN